MARNIRELENVIERAVILSTGSVFMCPIAIFSPELRPDMTARSRKLSQTSSVSTSLNRESDEVGSFRTSGRGNTAGDEPINALLPDEEAWNRPSLVGTQIPENSDPCPPGGGRNPTTSTIYAPSVMVTVSFVRRKRRLG